MDVSFSLIHGKPCKICAKKCTFMEVFPATSTKVEYEVFKKLRHSGFQFFNIILYNLTTYCKLYCFKNGSFLKIVLVLGFELLAKCFCGT